MAAETKESTGREAAMVGLGFGGVFGGMLFGSAADLLHLPMGTMAVYAVGVVLGAFAGMIAGRIAGSLLL